MEIDTADDGIVLRIPSHSGLNISLHPLVLINISDHATRFRVQPDFANSIVAGALLGTQNGRDVELLNSFELLLKIENGKARFDSEYFLTKQSQFRQVFPTLDFLGWYTTGSSPKKTETDLHQQLTQYNESPLLLQLDTAVNPTIKDLPVFIYESVIELVNESPQIRFVKSEYKLETGEAERIAVDHVAKISNDSGASGVLSASLVTSLVSQKNAISMMHIRIKILLEYLTRVQQGILPTDHNILREASSLLTRLPTLETPRFREEFITDFNDLLLITYLATITKDNSLLSDALEKFAVQQDRGTRKGKGKYDRIL